MIVDIKRRGSAVRLELQGTGTQIYNKMSKTSYTRAFLLTCADLDVCKQLPAEGLDPLLLRSVLEDAPRENFQSWRRSGDVPVNPFGKTEGNSLESTKRAAYGPKSPTMSGASSDNLSPGLNLNGEINLQEKRYSAQCKARILDQSHKEVQKTGFYQLRKSENPYRPPHVLQVGSNKLEEKSLSEKSNSFEVTHSGRKETRSRAQNISSDKDDPISISGVEVVGHRGNTVDLCLTKDFPSDSDSYKINLSMNSRESNEEHSRMLLKEHAGSFLTAKNINLSTATENAEPKYLATNLESAMRCSANLRTCRTEGMGSDRNHSSEKHSVNIEMRQDDKPISNTQLSELCCSRAPNSGLTGSDDWATRTDFSKPYEFPFVDAFDFLTSSAGDGIATRTHQKRIMAADVAGETELYDMEDNGLNFEDVWSEVLAAMQFEQEMDCISASEYGQTADSEIQVPLPDGNSFILTAHPSSCEILEGNNCDNSTDSDAEICLPDQNNLISIDHTVVPDSLWLEGDKNSVKDDTWTSNLTDKAAKKPATLDISPHKRRWRCAPRRSTVTPLHDIKATCAHQDLHFQPSYLPSPWTAITAPIPHVHPFDFQQAQMTIQMPSVVPMLHYPYSAVNWYTCTNMHHQPSPSPSPPPKECYSLQQQPFPFP